MSDIKCPNCQYEQYICHDDGQGFSEDETHEQYCGSCEYYFKYTTSISYTFYAYCAKPEDHNMELVKNHANFYHCSKCEFHEIKDKEEAVKSE